MSSTEPPSRVPPRVSHETKAAQQDLASTRKVEKVREVDPDEQAKRNKFRQMMGDEMVDDVSDSEQAPSPFELFSASSTPSEGAAPFVGDVAESPVPRSSFGDVEDAVVASPSYSPPPDIPLTIPTDDEEDEDEATTNALPQSDSFWEDLDLPTDQLQQPTQYEETPKSIDRAAAKGGMGTQPQGKAKIGGKPPGKTDPATGMTGMSDKKTAPSPFGPPGKPIAQATPPPKQSASPQDKKKLPTPFEAAAVNPKGKMSQQPTEMTSTARYVAPEEKGKPGAPPTTKEKIKEAQLLAREPDAVPFRLAEEREGGGGGSGKGRGAKIIDIEAPSLPLLPAQVQPMAFAATSFASSYLHPTTVSLFFQMVGTIFVMVAPPGVSRTEIVLNNPAYANSKFFGSTITIEKYATAPDSLNIRLTGSDEAVTVFRDHIPSLMTAFQNSKLPFKVHRIDAEYSTERPVFRRKERGEGKGEMGGGDLGGTKK